MLEIHPFDAELRGIVDGDLVALVSRSGDIALKARISERMQPGVVYTTFHHAKTGANVITTDYSDWATNCPEYKVTAVQVRKTNRPSDWQARFFEEDEALKRVAMPWRRRSRPVRGHSPARVHCLLSYDSPSCGAARDGPAPRQETAWGSPSRTARQPGR